MLPLRLGLDGKRLTVLCLGAHGDDIEIGCGGALLRWLREYRRVELTWVVASVTETRAKEARSSARALAHGAASLDIVLGDFPDAHLPAEFARVKSFVGDLRERVRPDVILTHRLEDRHQDHRLLAELTWQTWRDHLILEYEVPKYEGDLGQPNLFVPLTAAIARRKAAHVVRHFSSQRSKTWFGEETFLALMRVRGIECRAWSGFAEGFYLRKAVAGGERP
jgi:LmbE family N-acetylglucosaminyl deacetylase